MVGGFGTNRYLHRQIEDNCKSSRIKVRQLNRACAHFTITEAGQNDLGS